jgi:integrase
MVLDCLAQVLDDTVEYGLLDTNAARGKRRRMRLPQSRRTFLEPDQVVDLLDAAGHWERELLADERFADRVIRGRRALLATLCLAGPRIHELTAATRARLDVHGGRLRIGEAKTEAGLRDVELTAFLLDELRGHLAGCRPSCGSVAGRRCPFSRQEPVATTATRTSAIASSPAL